MEGLPKDVVFLLLQWFGTADVERLGATCRAWRAMVGRFWNEAAKRAELHCSLVVLSRSFKFHQVEELHLYVEDNTTSELVTVFSLRNCRKLCVFGSRSVHSIVREKELALLSTHCPRLEWLQVDYCEMFSIAIRSAFKTERELVRGIKVILGRKGDWFLFRGIENRAALDIAIEWAGKSLHAKKRWHTWSDNSRATLLAFLRFRRGDPDWMSSVPQLKTQKEVESVVESIEESTLRCSKSKDSEFIMFTCEDCLSRVCAFCAINCHEKSLNHVTMLALRPPVFGQRKCICLKCEE